MKMAVAAPARVTVFTTMPPGVYSGGRYLSLILAYSLARAGAQVTYVTNNRPVFDGDFAPYERQWPVRKVIGNDFRLPADLQSDWVVVIPTGSFDSRFYNAALDHARQSDARIALLSFETPNWYNALSPFPRSPMPTESWRQVVARGGLVVTIAAEGVEPARQYFGEGTQGARLVFGHWHPPINDLAAARAEELEGAVAPDLRRRVTMFARIEDPHKGAHDLLRLPPDLFEGHLLSLIFGRGVPAPYLEALRRHFAPARDFAIEVHSRISDEIKFRLLARSRLLLFPSYFEGFGYPPVEAAWMGVPTVCYDLPLLHEMASPALRPVPIGDAEAFAAAVRSALDGPPGPPLPRSLLAEPPDTLSAGRRLLQLFAETQDRIATIPAPPVATPIPRTSLSEAPAIRAFAGRHQGGIHLLDAQGEVREGTLRLRGRIAGAAAEDRLRCTLAGVKLPEMPLRPLPDGSCAFEVEGVIERWPEDMVLVADCVLLRAKDRKAMALGGIPLRPDWPALLERPAGSRLVAASLPEAVFAADPVRLLRAPLQLSAFAEMSEALRRHGWRSRLLLPADSPGPERLADGEPDLLPWMDRVEILPRDAIMSRLAGAGETSLAILGCGMDLPQGRRGLQLLLHDGAGGPAEDGPVLLAAALPPGQREVVPDVRLARRSLLAARSGAVILLLPDRVIEDLSPDLLRTLAAVEPWTDRLRVILPRRLWAGGLPPMLGQAGALEILSEAELARLLSAAGAAAGLALGAGDQTGRLLLRAFGWPLLQEGCETLDADLRAALRPPAPPEGSLAALLAGLLPPARPLRLLDRIALDRGRREPRETVPVRPVRIGAGEVVSLSNTLPVPAGLLVSGWRDRDLYGARMGQEAALLSFGLQDEAPLPAGSMIELLLRLSGQPEPDLALRVLLNGQTLGRIASIPAGVSSHVLPVPRHAWRPGERQILVLTPEQPRPADSQTGVTLMALFLKGPSSAAPALPLPSGAAAAQPRAPLAPPHLWIESDRLSCRFGQGAETGFAYPLAGWSAPEPDWVWSDGAMAALGFQPALAGNAILLRFEGQAFLPAGETAPRFQRVRLRSGAVPLGLAVLRRGAAAFTAILPASLTRRGLDHLLLEFPDACRPADHGMGPDSRQLGLALRSLSARSLTHCLARSEAPPEGIRSWMIDLPEGARALRILGSGPVPAGLQIGAPDGATLVAPVADDDGRWEAWLPLEEDGPARETATVALLGPAVRLRGVEIWSDGEQAAGPAHRRLVLFTEPWIGAEEDIAALLEHWQMAARLAADNAPLPLPARYAFTSSGAPNGGQALLAEGWSQPEPIGCWSDGPGARLVLPAPIGGQALALVDLSAFVPAGLPEQRVLLALDGEPALTLRIGPPEIVALILPQGSRSIAFSLPDALAPAQIGLSADARRLGILLRSLDVEPLADPGSLLALPAGLSAEIVGLAGSRVVLRLSGPDPVPWGLTADREGETRRIVHPRPVAGGGWEAVLVLSGEEPDPPVIRVLPEALSDPRLTPEEARSA